MSDDNDKPTLDELPSLLAVELATIGRALSSVSRTVICGILDDAVARASAALARAEAVEARVAELEADRDDAVAAALSDVLLALKFDPNDIENDQMGLAAQGIIAAMNQRLEELEQQLAALQAAQQWRPVTEPPGELAWYETVVDNGTEPRPEHQVYRPGLGWAMSDTHYWRPIPPLPDAAEEGRS